MTPYAFIRECAEHVKSAESARRRVSPAKRHQWDELMEGMKAGIHIYENLGYTLISFPQDWEPAPEIRDEAVERFKEAPNFPLPFEYMTVFIDRKFEVTPTSNIERETVMVFVQRLNENEIVGSVLLRMERKNKNLLFLPLGLWRILHSDQVNASEPDSLMMQSKIICQDFYTSQDIPLEKINDSMGQYARLALGCVWSLMARGVKTEMVPPEPKLNKKNVQRGLPRTSPYLKVIIDEPVVRRARYPSTGTHAPPRPHWRRGHLRTLPNATKTYVRPCFVGGENGEYCDPGLRMYKCELSRLAATT